MEECFSRDGETYQPYDEWDTINDILNDYENPLEAIGHTYYKGVSRKPKPSSLFCLDWLVEDMQERAYDEYGEWSEDYLTGEDLTGLELLICDWLDRNISVSFYSVEDVVQKSVTKEMVEEYLKESV